MPKNKDAYSRYRIIDQILRRRKGRGSGKYVKSSELVEICAERLGLDEISPRTIQNDILTMREGTVLRMNAPIQYSKSEKAHYYPENVDEIFPAIELTDEEISALLFYSQVQGQYQQFEIFKEIKETIDKVLDAANVRGEYREVLSGNPVIYTEETPLLKGNELLRIIIQAIVNKRKIRFSYKKFTGEQDIRILSPYILKEDNHLWYVVGCLDGKDFITTFAIDRMNDIGMVNEKMRKISFSPKKYFQHSVGITVPEPEPVEVILSFDPYQGNYLKALSFHNSQSIIVDDDQEFRISIYVKPAYEFYAKILSYGNKVKVISPDFVIEEIKTKLSEALNHY